MAEYTQNYNLEKQKGNDYVDIEGINGNFDIIDSELKETKDKAEQAFQSASNGKALINNAITGVDPDVSIPTDATFTQLASAIGQIKTGVDTEDATATAEQILTGMTAYVKGVKVTGNMTNHGVVNITPGTANQVIPKGYHNGSGGVAGDPNLVSGNIKSGVSIFGKSGKNSVVDTADANVTAGQMLTGYSGYVNGSKINGNIPVVNPDYNDQMGTGSVSAGAYTGDGANYAYMYLGLNGKYVNGINYIRHYEPYLVPACIVPGASIMGVAGAASMGKKFANGTVEITTARATFYYQSGSIVNNYPFVTVSGLTFTPTFIHIICFQWNGVYEYVTQYTTITGNETREPSFKTAIYNKSSGPSGGENFSALKGAAYVNSTGFCAPILLGDAGTICYWHAYE